MHKRDLIIGLIVLIFFSCESHVIAHGISQDSVILIDSVKDVIEKQVDVLLSKGERTEGGMTWNYPSYLGANYISEYYVVSKWLAHDSPLDEDRLKHLLTTTQMSDGSWQNVKQANINHGDIDSTILNYWALKAMGEDSSSDNMTKARRFILDKGGIEKSMTMTKFWLALFGNYEWNKLPVIPLFAFDEGWIQKYFDLRLEVSQWVYPHLLGMAYLRHLELKKEVDPPLFDLSELYSTEANAIANTRLHHQMVLDRNTEILSHGSTSSNSACDGSLANVIDRLMKIRQPHGSFGAYTVSTLFAIITLDDYSVRCPNSRFKDEIPQAIKKGYSFINTMYFDSGSSAYLGVLDDGHYWDTALVAGALSEGLQSGLLKGYDQDGKVKTAVIDAAKVLIAQQNLTNTGGIPFGIDFWYAPDVDDTAEMASFLHHLEKIVTSTTSTDMSMSWISEGKEKAIDFLRHMQNKDGGWGAFDKDRNGGGIMGDLVKLMASGFANSAEIFDPSSNDVTAHILECFGLSGIGTDDPNVQAAIEYFKKTQENDGSFLGRWGINYVYATPAAIVGLRRVGYKYEGMVEGALNWLLSVQNEDGGFGESSQSYVDPSLKGKGISTVSQTAWALLGLLEGYRVDKSTYEGSVQRAVTFLVNSYPWMDASAVGTGHPGILYMWYPSYSQAFPLIALERFLEYWE